LQINAVLVTGYWGHLKGSFNKRRQRIASLSRVVTINFFPK
jgi:Tfp pilus assembly protein PilO